MTKQEEEFFLHYNQIRRKAHLTRIYKEDYREGVTLDIYQGNKKILHEDGDTPAEVYERALAQIKHYRERKGL